MIGIHFLEHVTWVLSVLGATCSNRVNEKQADVLEAERREEGSGTNLNSG